MEHKYFKKVYADRIGYGKWQTGDGINYNGNPERGYTVEFITKTQYTNGVKNMPEIPKTKEQLIHDKMVAQATDALKLDGVLDSNGDLI